MFKNKNYETISWASEASIVIHNMERTGQPLLRLMNFFKQLMERAMKMNSQTYVDLTLPHVKQSKKFHNIVCNVHIFLRSVIMNFPSIFWVRTQGVCFSPCHEVCSTIFNHINMAQCRISELQSGKFQEGQNVKGNFMFGNDELVYSKANI